MKQQLGIDLNHLSHPGLADHVQNHLYGDGTSVLADDPSSPPRNPFGQPQLLHEPTAQPDATSAASAKPVRLPEPEMHDAVRERVKEVSTPRGLGGAGSSVASAGLGGLGSALAQAAPAEMHDRVREILKPMAPEPGMPYRAVQPPQPEQDSMLEKPSGSPFLQ